MSSYSIFSYHRDWSWQFQGKGQIEVEQIKSRKYEVRPGISKRQKF